MFFFFFLLVFFLKEIIIVFMAHRTIVVGDSITGGINPLDDNSKPMHASQSTGGEVYLRGFNTVPGIHPTDEALLREGAGEILAAISGTVEVTERVVSIRGKFSRYFPEIGDVVVGRVTEIIGNKWIVDINGSQLAVMALSNVSEPGGILRRRGRDDELTMRELFDQGDVIAAEVQRVSPDDIPFLQCKAGEKYGRITTVGKLVSVRASLVKRSKHFFVSFSAFNVSVIIGVNGNIWVCELMKDWADRTLHSEEVESHAGSHTGDSSPSLSDSYPLHKKIEDIARVANCIKLMNDNGIIVHSESIKNCVGASIAAGVSAPDLLLESNRTLPFFRDQPVVPGKHPRS